MEIPRPREVELGQGAVSLDPNRPNPILPRQEVMNNLQEQSHNLNIFSTGIQCFRAVFFKYGYRPRFLRYKSGLNSESLAWYILNITRWSITIKSSFVECLKVKYFIKNLKVCVIFLVLATVQYAASVIKADPDL